MRVLPILTTLIGLAVSLPTEPAADAAAAAPQMVHLVFHAAAATYDLTIPADGQPHPTNNELNVNLIDAPDFNIEWCEFKTHQPVAMVWQAVPSGVSNWRISEYAVGPPQPIDAVTCRGTCLGVYSMLSPSSVINLPCWVGE